MPTNCSFLNCYRLPARGGEVLLVQLNNTQRVVYRLKPHMDFSKELFDAVLKYNRLFIVGDFNTHVCCKLNSLAKDFISLVNSFDFTQVVNGPTHKHGHTLDLVLLTRFFQFFI